MIILDFSNSKVEILNQLSSSKESWSTDIYLFLEEWWNGNDFIIAETSGSTGKPKSINLKKNRVISSVRATIDFFELKKGNNALLCISPKFIAGKLMIVRAVVSKMILICVKPNSSPIEKFPNNIKIDFAAMVPLQVSNSINNLNHKIISKLIIGGGVVDNVLLNKVEKSSSNIYATYGMTETITHVAIKRLNGSCPDLNFKALPNIKFRKDKRGCLLIDAPYLNDNCVATNDIVELVDNKTFKWLGRFDNVINSGGIKINPEKIEGILSNSIKDSFIITSIPDEVLGEKLILIIEGENNNIDLKIIKSKLPKYQSPKKIYFLKEFARTDSGKINRGKTKDYLNLNLS